MSKIYTREEMCEVLNMPLDSKGHNIQRELRKRGYEFSCSYGRGKPYLIEVTKEPEINLIWFAKTFFNLTIRPSRVKDFAHFLNFLFTSGEKEKAINYPVDYIATRVFYSRDTIREYIDAIKHARAFVNTGEPICWGIRYTRVNLTYPSVLNEPEDKDMGSYEKKKMIKEFPKGHKDFAQQTFWNYFDYWMKENKKHDKKIKQEWEMRIEANAQKKLVAGGWWILPTEYDKYRISDKWRPSPLLLSLLGDYEYSDIYKTEVKSIADEYNEYFDYEDAYEPALKPVRPPEDYVFEPEIMFEPNIELIAKGEDPDIYIPSDILTIDDAMKYLKNSGEYKKL